MKKIETYEDIKKKLLSLPKKFRKFYDKRQWSQAKHCYDVARTVACFMELPEDEMEVLFGNREKEIRGMFREEEVQHVFLHTVVRGNEDRADDTYEKNSERHNQRMAAGFYTKK